MKEQEEKQNVPDLYVEDYEEFIEEEERWQPQASVLFRRKKTRVPLPRPKEGKDR